MPGRGCAHAGAGALYYAAHTGAVAWILLAGQCRMAQPPLCDAAGTERGPVQHLQLPAWVLVIALYSYPYIFIFTTAALELVSSEMEDAANILARAPGAPCGA